MTDSSPQPALGRPTRSMWTRRLIMVAIILAVAAGVMLTTESRDAKRTDAVRTMVEAACLEVASRRDRPDEPLSTAVEQFLGPGMRGPIAAALSDDDGFDRSRLDVRILPDDDPPPLGDGRASHRAIVSVRGRAVLILRILQGTEATDLHVLGYRVPEGDQALLP